MRVGIDIGPLAGERTGVGNYCYFLLKHLLQQGRHEYVGLCPATGRPDLNGLPLAYRRIALPTRILYRTWDAFGLPQVDTRLGGVDVYHATNYVLPPTRRAKRVVTVHDLAFIAVPELCSPKIAGIFGKNIGRYCREADAILVYSESTKLDLRRFLDVDETKIFATPMAVDTAFAPVDRDTAKEQVYVKYGVAGPFLLFVSTLEPRKNVVGLLEIFARLAKEFPHKLVLIGSVGWNAQPMFDAITRLGIGDRVVRPGYVPHGELPLFYSTADAFVFPTHYEGFGLPLLEALACGCPVVASDNTSVPEVTGDAALLAAADDVDAQAANVRRVLTDEALRAELIEKGFVQAKRFSWDRCAADTAAVYEHVAGISRDTATDVRA
ncbi:MAG: glycosyltransferase family 1 protein [Candidatus Hydrogenedentales bacterium]